MEVLTLIDPKSLYSKFADHGVRPDARLPGQPRPLTLVSRPVAVPEGVSCIARVGKSSVMVAAYLTEATVGAARDALNVRVHVTAASSGIQSSSQGAAAEVGMSLQQELQALYGTGTLAWAVPHADRKSKQYQIAVDVMPLCDDGCLVDVATYAMSAALTMLPPFLPEGVAFTLLRKPVSATVAVITRTGEGEGQAVWLVHDPSSSCGEAVPACGSGSGPWSGFVLSVPGGAHRLGADKHNITGATAVHSVPVRSGGTAAAMTPDNLPSRLAAAHVRVAVDALSMPSGASPDDPVLLAVRVLQPAEAQGQCPAHVIREAMVAAHKRAVELVPTG